jgi:hypothetical protein
LEAHHELLQLDLLVDDRGICIATRGTGRELMMLMRLVSNSAKLD